MIVAWGFVVFLFMVAALFCGYARRLDRAALGHQIYLRVKREKFHGLQGFEWVYFKCLAIQPSTSVRITKEEYEAGVNYE